MALDKLVDSTQLDSALEATADAIREKTGSESPIVWDMSTGFADEISNISGSGGSQGTQNYSDDDRVLFFDDLSENPEPIFGYTAAEFLNLTEMPPNPDHTDYKIPMRSCGWNTTLAEAKAYVQQYGALMIGQTYEPADGLTHMVIDITSTEDLNIVVHIENSNRIGYSIDWGDNTQETALVNATIDNDNDTYSHQYASIGEYIITFKRPVINEYIDTMGETGQEYCDYYEDGNYQENTYYYNTYDDADEGYMYINQTWVNVDLGLFFGLYDRVISVSGKENSNIPQYILKEIYLSAFDCSPNIKNCVNLQKITIPPPREEFIINYEWKYLDMYYLSQCILPAKNYSLRGITFPGNYSNAAGDFVTDKVYSSSNNGNGGGLYSLVYICFPPKVYINNYSSLNPLVDVGPDFKSLKYITFPSVVTDYWDSNSTCYEYDYYEPTDGDGLKNIRTLEIASIPAIHFVENSENDTYHDMPAECFKETNIRDYIIRDVKNVGAEAFRACKNLKKITVQNSVESIGNYAFADCTELKELVLSNTLSSIPTGMCSNDISLRYIEIPASVTTINNLAFENCKYLTIKILNTNMEINLENSNAFTGPIKILVPNNLLSSYKRIGGDWYAYRDSIYGY